MTAPRNSESDDQTLEPADPEPEVKPEVIEDLAVTSDDAEHIAGASLIHCETR